MTNLTEYRRRVERLAIERTGEPIANGSVDHASIIIENMFKNAKKQVSILSGHLGEQLHPTPGAFVRDGRRVAFVLEDREAGVDMV